MEINKIKSKEKHRVTQRLMKRAKGIMQREKVVNMNQRANQGKEIS